MDQGVNILLILWWKMKLMEHGYRVVGMLEHGTEGDRVKIRWGM